MDSQLLMTCGLLAALAWASPVYAQNGGITVTLKRVGTVEYEATDTDQAVSIAQCDDEVTIEFDLTTAMAGTLTDKQSIDIYTGTDCNGADRNNTDTGQCTYITTSPTQEGSGNQFTIEVSTASFGECSVDTDSTPTLWFLVVDTAMSSEPVTIYGKYDLKIDRTRPEAPRGVQGGTGERQIPIEWKNDDTEIEEFIVFIDSGSPGEGAKGAGAVDGGAGATNTDCGSGVLRAGSSGDSVPSSLESKTISGGTATSTDLSASDIDGMSAAVAVVAVDIAGNRSVLSNVACVEVVPTEGFWDRYQKNGGEIEGGCPCTALGPAHLHSAWPIALALGFGALSSRRRRRP